MLEFLVMAQREHKRLGVALTDAHQKQPAQWEKAGQGQDHSGGGGGGGGLTEILPVLEPDRTRLLVPAGG